ncbi:MAG: hypothetical protein IT425_03025 [Pirellulales bacterium]|nr:hypothetical protein [Pirellulales bacterium]
MDCDQVFMILTRGPFPTGEAWDEQVETHLETCGDCWRLAEALRPALEIFQEAVPPAEGRNLPGYWGDARPSSSSLGHLTSHTIGASVKAIPRRILAVHSPAISPQLESELSSRLLRAVAITATVAATAVALLTLL